MPNRVPEGVWIGLGVFLALIIMSAVAVIGTIVWTVYFMQPAQV